MKKKQSQRGSALLLVTVVLLIMIGISGAYLTLSWGNKTRSMQDYNSNQALFIAEAGAAAYISNLNATSGLPAPINTKQYIAGGYYWVPTENFVDFSNAAIVGANNKAESTASNPYYAFQVAGKYGNVTRRLDVIVTGAQGGVFWNAIYAGNSGDITRI